MLNVERLDMGDITTLRVSGEVDGVGANTLRDAIKQCVAEKRYHLVITMSHVMFLSYMGAGVLVEGLGLVQTFHGDIKLASLNIQSRRLLSMMGLGHVFELHSSEMSAVQGYKQEAA